MSAKQNKAFAEAYERDVVLVLTRAFQKSADSLNSFMQSRPDIKHDATLKKCFKSLATDTNNKAQALLRQKPGAKIRGEVNAMQSIVTSYKQKNGLK